MATLTIGSSSGEVILNMVIPDIDPMLALPAIVKALADLPKPMGVVRKKRKDAGTRRNVVAMPEAS